MNPTLRKLGYCPDDRVAILHIDDVGMCQATLPAFAEAIEAGLITSGSVMVPPPWFPEAAAWACAHPGVDVGVHLTLTSEGTGYRWRPLSRCEPSAGLTDAEGYFPPDAATLWAHADPLAVRAEVEAQIDLALRAGLAPTHIDSHMYAALDPRFAPHYAELALVYKLPAMIPRNWRQFDAEMQLRLRAWEAQGLPIFDHFSVMNLAQWIHDPVAGAKHVLAQLPPGLSCVLVHPAQDTPELRAIFPGWQARVAEYEACIHPDLRAYCEEIGLHRIPYRTLQAVMA